MDILKRIKQRGTKMMTALKHLSSVREVRLFILEKRLGEVVINVQKYMKRG